MRWASCNIFSTQDHAAAAIAARGTPVFAYKGESLEEYWDYIDHMLDWGDGQGPNMILDDGGDATLFVHLGYQALSTIRRSWTASRAAKKNAFCSRKLKKSLKKNPSASRTWPKDIRGVTEETTTGVHRLYQMHERRASCCSRRSTSTTPSPSRNSTTCTAAAIRWWTRINRATDVMLAGKIAVVAGYGDVGKGSAQSLRGASGARDHHGNRSDLRAAGGDGRLRSDDDG